MLEAEQRQVVQVAEQTSAIAIALKSKDQSQADAEANEALAEAVRSEEGVVTARETAVAERSKAIQLIDAQRVAEQQAIGVRIGAEVERDAAENRAQAVRVVAEAQRDAALAEAEGISAVNEARNRMGESQINMTVRMRLIDNLPTIIQNMVKPMEKIDSIKLFHVTGMPGAQVLGHDGAKTVSSGGGQGSMPEQVMNAALQYQVGKPFLDAIMADAGLGDTSISGLSKSLATMAVPGALIPGAAANESAVSALALSHGGAPAGALTADSAS